MRIYSIRSVDERWIVTEDGVRLLHAETVERAIYLAGVLALGATAMGIRARLNLPEGLGHRETPYAPSASMKRTG